MQSIKISTVRAAAVFSLDSVLSCQYIIQPMTGDASRATYNLTFLFRGVDGVEDVGPGPVAGHRHGPVVGGPQGVSSTGHTILVCSIVTWCGARLFFDLTIGVLRLRSATDVTRTRHSIGVMIEDMSVSVTMISTGVTQFVTQEAVCIIVR